MRRQRKHTFERKAFIISIAMLVPALIMLGVYIYGINRYKSCFINGTVIDNVDVSGMTIPQLTQRVEGYVLKVEQRRPDGSSVVEEINGTEIGLLYASLEPFEKILEDQNNLLWFVRQETEQNLENMITYDEEALEEKIRSLSGFSKDFTVEPSDAYLSEYIPQTGFRIIEENDGNSLDMQKTLEAIGAAVEGLEEYVSLEKSECYKKAKITSENEELKAKLEKLQKYADTKITYTFGDKKEVLDGDKIITWLKVDGSDITLDENQVAEYVGTLKKSCNTVFRKRKFKTSYDLDITIDRGDYGWWLDTEQETKGLIEAIKNGESGERTPVYRQTAATYDTPDYGDTYVEINLTAQHLLLYIDGKVVLESDFVSGNSASGYDTPPGIYGITYKERNATLSGQGYNTPVSYWMPFNNNVGMHDAKWRSSFGGDIYKTNGSHGCVNLPFAVAEKIYGYVEKGTPVICYYLPGTEPKPKNNEETASEPEQSEAVPEQSESIPSLPEAVPEQPGEVPSLPEAVPEQPEVPVSVPAEVPQ